MPRVCTVCTHASCEAIEKTHIEQTPFRNIAEQFHVSVGVLTRHKTDHLPQVLARAAAPVEREQGTPRSVAVPVHAPALAQHVAQRESAAALHAIDIMDQVQRLFDRINLLFDACDRWLHDADDDSQYGHRSTCQ